MLIFAEHYQYTVLRTYLIYIYMYTSDLAGVYVHIGHIPYMHMWPGVVLTKVYSGEVIREEFWQHLKEITTYSPQEGPPPGIRQGNIIAS